jgi:hypothetical protein
MGMSRSLLKLERGGSPTARVKRVVTKPEAARPHNKDREEEVSHGLARSPPRITLNLSAQPRVKGYADTPMLSRRCAPAADSSRSRSLRRTVQIA